MKKLSAGILLFRHGESELEVFLVHPGGPFWAKKDAGAWSIPKGEYTDTEDALTTAKREFKEETGVGVDGKFLSLGTLKQPSGKVVTAWALEQGLDPSALKSNTFALEWPPRSGRIRNFPEVDRGGWFSLPAAHDKMLKGQLEFLKRLADYLSANHGDLPI
jgi:predicted NUDIX family NTP pyrophosphohydrolase